MTAYNHSSGYTYGTDDVPTSPLTLEDLRQIEPPHTSSPVTQSCSHEQNPSWRHTLWKWSTRGAEFWLKRRIWQHIPRTRTGSRTPSTRRRQSRASPSGSSTCARASVTRRGWTTST